jgi:hypothetical protein
MTVTGVEGVSRPPPPRGRPRAGGFLRRWMVGVLAILAGVWVVRYAQRNDMTGNLHLREWWQEARQSFSLPNLGLLKNLGGNQPAAPSAEESPEQMASPEAAPEQTQEAANEASPAPMSEPTRPMGEGEIASLERVAGDERIRVLQDSPVYQHPDVSSAVVGTVHEGKLMMVTGTTASFVQIYLTKTDVEGYVPMDVGNVLTSPRGGICYALAAGTRLYQTPNRSSQIVDEVGPESEIMSQADAIGGYALVKTVHGRRGFVTGAAIGQSVGCAEAFESE